MWFLRFVLITGLVIVNSISLELAKNAHNFSSQEESTGFLPLLTVALIILFAIQFFQSLGKSSEPEEEIVLVYHCHNCGRLSSKDEYFCSECGASVGYHNNMMPFLWIHSFGDALIKPLRQKARFPVLNKISLFLIGLAYYGIFVFWYLFRVCKAEKQLCEFNEVGS